MMVKSLEKCVFVDTIATYWSREDMITQQLVLLYFVRVLTVMWYEAKGKKIMMITQ